MSNAGYGNHDDKKPGSASPSSGSPDRPGADLGGAQDRSGAAGPTGAVGGGRSQPDPSGTGPHSGLEDANASVLSDEDPGDVATPGDGAGPDGPQGDEVDPGAG